MNSQTRPSARTLLRPGTVVSLLPDCVDVAVVVDAAVGEVTVEVAPGAPLPPAGPLGLRVGAPGVAWRVEGDAFPDGRNRLVLRRLEVVGAIEDREFGRLPVALDAEYAPAGPRRIADGWHPAAVADFSAGGVALVGADANVDDTLLVRFRVPVPAGAAADDCLVEARARVVRRVRRADGTVVIGLAWDGLEWRTRERLSAAFVAGTR